VVCLVQCGVEVGFLVLVKVVPPVRLESQLLEVEVCVQRDCTRKCEMTSRLNWSLAPAVVCARSRVVQRLDSPPDHLA